MPIPPHDKARDAVLLRMLKTPPKPHASLKGKKKASPAKSKAKKV